MSLAARPKARSFNLEYKMATKKPMKKPVKRVRRFQEGGEAALKAEGLAASNKDAPLGFFESLRRFGQGNIDQEGSEAYNRYGAGRGRMERAAASEFPSNAGNGATTRALAPVSANADAVKIADAQGAREMDEEMYQRGRRAGEVVDSADRYRDYTPIAKPLAAAQNAALLAKPSRTSSGTTTGDLARIDRKVPSGPTPTRAPGGVGKRRAASAEDTAAASSAAAPAASPAATSRNDSSTTSTQSAPASNGSKFDASDALGAGLAVASVIPIVRGGRTLYQAGKKMYQTYKAAKDAIKNRPKLDRPGTVSGEGFVMRDVKDPSAVAKAPQKALPAPRKGDVTDVTPKNMDSQSLRAAARRGDDDARAERFRRGLTERGIVKDTADKNLRERGNKYLFADDAPVLKRGGAVKKMASGGSVKSSVSTASKRGDGIALRGKTRGKIY